MEKKRILVVDDMPPILSMIKLLLREEFQVFPVNSGAAALELLEASGVIFDLVILDVDMPGISGFELLTRIKSNPITQDIPVVMLTGNADQYSVIRAAKSGAAGYIVKPFTEDILKKKVHSVLKQP
jgi:CheY-like chemotaxis protein